MTLEEASKVKKVAKVSIVERVVRKAMTGVTRTSKLMPTISSKYLIIRLFQKRKKNYSTN